MQDLRGELGSTRVSNLDYRLATNHMHPRWLCGQPPTPYFVRAKLVKIAPPGYEPYIFSFTLVNDPHTKTRAYRSGTGDSCKERKHKQLELYQ